MIREGVVGKSIADFLSNISNLNHLNGMINDPIAISEWLKSDTVIVDCVHVNASDSIGTSDYTNKSKRVLLGVTFAYIQENGYMHSVGMSVHYGRSYSYSAAASEKATYIAVQRMMNNLVSGYGVARTGAATDAICANMHTVAWRRISEPQYKFSLSAGSIITATKEVKNMLDIPTADMGDEDDEIT